MEGGTGVRGRREENKGLMGSGEGKTKARYRGNEKEERQCLRRKGRNGRWEYDGGRERRRRMISE